MSRVIRVAIRRVIGVLLLVATVSACSVSTTKTGQVDLDRPPVSARCRLGGSRESEPVRYPHTSFLSTAEGGWSFGIYETPASAELIRTIATPIRRFFGGDESFPPVHVSVDLEYGARSTPDGKVYLSMTALAQAKSDDEIAALISHEMAHVACRHGRASSTQMAIDWLMEGGTLGVVLAGIPYAALVLMPLQHVYDKYMRAGFARAQELEADALAVDALIATRSEVNGLIAALGRLREPAGARDVSAFSGPGHPVGAERMAAVTEHLRQVHPGHRAKPLTDAARRLWLERDRGMLAAVDHALRAYSKVWLPLASMGRPELVRNRDAPAAAARYLQFAFGQATPTASEVQVGVPEAVPSPSDPNLPLLEGMWFVRTTRAELEARAAGGLTPAINATMAQVIRAPDTPQWFILNVVVASAHFGDYHNADRFIDLMQSRFRQDMRLCPLQEAVRRLNPVSILGNRLRLALPGSMACAANFKPEVALAVADAQKNPRAEIDRWWRLRTKDGF